MALPVFLYLRQVAKVEPIAYLGITRRGLLAGAVIGAGWFALYFLLFGVLRGVPANWSLTFGRWVSTLTLATFAEEVLFRGFLLQGWRRLHEFWRAAAGSAILFAGIHWPGWILLGEKPLPEMATLSLPILLLGLALAWLREKTGSLAEAGKNSSKRASSTCSFSRVHVYDWKTIPVSSQ